MIWLSAGLATAGVSAPPFLSPRRYEAGQIPSLLSRNLRFDATTIERAWHGIAAEKELGQFYFRDRVNRDFPLQALHCRVKYRDVEFYQAMLAPAGSRIEVDLHAAPKATCCLSLYSISGPGHSFSR